MKEIDSDNHKENESIEQRIPYWIEQLEMQIRRLLASINPEDLPPKERAAIAVRMMNQLQWFLDFTHQPVTKLSESSFEALTSLKRRMRGESEEGEEKE